MTGTYTTSGNDNAHNKLYYALINIISDPPGALLLNCVFSIDVFVSVKNLHNYIHNIKKYFDGRIKSYKMPHYKTIFVHRANLE